MATIPSTPSHAARHNIRDDPPILVVRYMDDFCDRLEAKRPAGMHASGDAQIVDDEPQGRHRDTAVGPWKIYWRNKSSVLTSELSFYFSNTDLLNARFYEEVEYEGRLGDIVAQTCSISENDWSFLLDDFFAIPRPYDQFQGIVKWAF